MGYFYYIDFQSLPCHELLKNILMRTFTGTTLNQAYKNLQKKTFLHINIFFMLTAVVCFFRYMFDEPSSYLDVKQRLNAARAIRSLLRAEKYVIVVEHDLAVLDYLSDFICVLYGVPGAYGVVTMPFSCKEGMTIRCCPSDCILV